MSDGVYDVIVIGAGVIGSSAAYHLSKKNKKTLLLEQFPVLHTRGSSHGHSRMTRFAYEKQFYTNMMPDSFKMVEDLERETNSQFYTNCGILMIGTDGCDYIRDIQRCLEGVACPHECLTPGELRRRCPMLAYPDNMGAIMDKRGGLLKADCFHRALQSVFQQRGGQIRDCEPVVDISPGSEVTVTTSKGQYRAASVIIAVGPWTNKLLQSLGLNLPLKPIRISVGYWKEVQPGSYSANRFPGFIARDGNPPYDFFWGIPSGEYPGYVKVGLNSGPEILPDERDQPDGQWVLKKVSNYIKKHLPGLQSTPAIVEQCIYTMTPDENFIIDHHPKHRNIIFAAGFSGHGFKLSPPIGLALSDMAVGRTPKYNMEPFKTSRFTAITKL